MEILTAPTQVKFHLHSPVIIQAACSWATDHWGEGCATFLYLIGLAGITTDDL